MAAPVNPTAELLRQRDLLLLERDSEREEFRHMNERAGIERLVARGNAWLPITLGRSYYNSLNQLVIEVSRDSDPDDDHNFEPGRAVMFFRLTGLDDVDYFDVPATVNRAEANRLIVTVPDSEAVGRLRQADRIGIQIALDETSYRLMIAALERAARADKGRLADLRAICYGGARAEWLRFDPMRFPWLNPTQETAVNQVLRAKDVAVVHGPPGTGKTTTLVEAIYETLRRESQVLVCAQSNMAVDWISERLVERGIDVLRVGNPSRVGDRMLGHTYERRFEDHPDYDQLWALRKALREVRAGRANTEAAHQKIDRLRSRITELELRIHAELMSHARVVACTLTGSANRVLEGMKFPTLFIDEAAQALEAACWIAIAKAGRVILAGDHCQLPPTVKSIQALQGGLGHTLMERLTQTQPEAVTLLGVQYRSNEQIMRFSSEWFYGGHVQSAPEVRHRGILDLDTPITWIDTDLDESAEQATRNFGRVNQAEAALTLDTLATYLERIGRTRISEEHIDIGLISPYRAQVQYLRSLLRKNNALKPYRQAITVNTIDGFQGQERDIIVISLVRANELGQIGFLRDLRRMNVAITRARMKLIILGNVATLTRHPFYKRLYQYTQSLNDA